MTDVSHVCDHVIVDNHIIKQDVVHLSSSDALPNTPFIVPFARWQNEADDLAQNPLFKGIIIDADVDVYAHAKALTQHTIIAIVFEQFIDGRGYSQARLLRTRFGYKGQLRAIGNILKDQMYYLQQCGFNAFELEHNKDIEDAQKGLSDFSVTYQRY